MSLESVRSRLIVALDVPTADAAVALAQTLDGHVGMLKVGLELFIAEGPGLLGTLRSRFPNLGIFLDLKLNDIPNTMRGAVRSARQYGATFLTVHASAGTDHLAACVDEAGDELGILAVTVLTSIDQTGLIESGHMGATGEVVAARAACAKRAGCAGVVCSGLELPSVREAAPGLFAVVPGIRPAGSAVGDQKRVMTPPDAIAAGATHLVVGRPIRSADDPAAAADAIVASMASVS